MPTLGNAVWLLEPCTNMPAAVSLGAIVQLPKAAPDKPTPIALSDLPKWGYRAQFGYGYNENGTATWAADGPRYPIYLAGLWAKRRVSSISYVLGGLQYYYNSGFRTYLASQESFALESTTANASVLIADLGYQVLYNRIAVELHAGFNVHNPFIIEYLNSQGASGSSKKYIAGKIGGMRYLKQPFDAPNWNAYVSLYVKSNVGQADFLETGIGIGF